LATKSPQSPTSAVQFDGVTTMISLAPNLPPVTLTDEAMKLCAALLQIASDPTGTKSRLDELTAATATLRAAIDEHAGVVTQAAEVAAAQETVAARETAVAEREGALVSERTRLDVASGALASRDAAVTAKEAAADRRQSDLDSREQALVARIEQYRAALA
jgi:hypothetical protein